MPTRPPRDSPPEVFQEWNRLYKRLRWILKMNAEMVGSVRPGAKLARLRRAAKLRRLGVDITLAEYRQMLEGGSCHYCGAQLPETGHGIDRKDSSLGYTLGNIVLACDACNRIKGDIFTYDQMVEIGNLLRLWRAEGRWSDPQRKDGRDFGGRPLKGDLRQEIVTWNERWLDGSKDSLGLPLGEGGGAAGGSRVVRESRGTYAVQGGDSELAYEFDDIRTLTMRLAGLGQRLKANQAGAGCAFAV